MTKRAFENCQYFNELLDVIYSGVSFEKQCLEAAMLMHSDDSYELDKFISPAEAKTLGKKSIRVVCDILTEDTPHATHLVGFVVRNTSKKYWFYFNVFND